MVLMAISNASLSARHVVAGVLLFADFVDLPLRVAYAPMPLTVPGSITDGDADCQGFTFDNLAGDILRIGTVAHDEGGTDTLTATLLADPANPDLLNAIEDPSIYAGRQFRIWAVLHNNAGAVTELRPLYRGYMMQPSQQYGGGEFTITMLIENWRAIIGTAPGRSYLNQASYDAGDLSANVSLGQGNAANGIVGGRFSDERGVYERDR
jgi:hypothetical protein